MKSEMIRRGLYVMSALVVVFGFCEFLIHLH